MSIRVPPTLRTIELIGATVVATFKVPLSASKSSYQPSDSVGAAAGVDSWAEVGRAAETMLARASRITRETEAAPKWERNTIVAITLLGTVAQTTIRLCDCSCIQPGHTTA